MRTATRPPESPTLPARRSPVAVVEPPPADSRESTGPTATEAPSAGSAHQPQLDALRALAVGVVMVQHFSPAEWITNDWGLTGVRLFFVLSGFLITGILVRAGAGAGLGSHPRAVALRRFYARRALRIVPAFYLVIAACLVLDVPEVRAAWPWHVSYASNVYFATHGWRGFENHFWTLAIEEQFYLVWPLVVLFAPARWLRPLTLALVVAAPLWRFGAVLAGVSERAVTLLMLGQTDALGLGAWLALRRSPERSGGEGAEPAGPAGPPPAPRGLLTWGLLLYGAAIVLEHSGPEPPVRAAFLALRGLGLSLAFGWLVVGAARGFAGGAGRLLRARPLVYVGTISYGVYLYHAFAIWGFGLVGFTLHRVAFPVYFGVLSLASVAVAAVSWHLFERPINALKRHFPY